MLIAKHQVVPVTQHEANSAVSLARYKGMLNLNELRAGDVL